MRVVIEKELYNKWNDDIWSQLIHYLPEYFWKDINLKLINHEVKKSIKEDIDKKQKLLTSKTNNLQQGGITLTSEKNNLFKNKYFKYKAKYLQLKNLL